MDIIWTIMLPMQNTEMLLTMMFYVVAKITIKAKNKLMHTPWMASLIKLPLKLSQVHVSPATMKHLLIPSGLFLLMLATMLSSLFFRSNRCSRFKY